MVPTRALPHSLGYSLLAALSSLIA
jgi:hypothetical protein